MELPAQPLDAAARATCLPSGALERVVRVSRAVLDEQNETRAPREDVTPDTPAKRAAHILRGESLAAAPESGHPPVRLLAEHEADHTRDLTLVNRGPRIAGRRDCAGGGRWGRRKYGARADAPGEGGGARIGVPVGVGGSGRERVRAVREAGVGLRRGARLRGAAVKAAGEVG